MSERLCVKKGVSFCLDVEQAVLDLSNAITQPDMTYVTFFCSSDYDLDALATALDEAFDCPVIGCTTAGEITAEDGYLTQTLVGFSVSSDEIFIHPQLIESLDKFDSNTAEKLTNNLRFELKLSTNFDPSHSFGLLLIDGMSMQEENVVASLYEQMVGMPIVGGSAGDDLKFNKAYVYWQGKFIYNAAVYTLFETTLPFKTFQTQHFEPTEDRLVITESDCETRTVSEINGVPAAQEYADTIGVDLDNLTPQIFADYPVMLKIGNQYYVRSIQKKNPDGSLTFYCAIQDGLVLRIGHSKNLIENLSEQLSTLHNQVPNIKFILGCDCILRRLELQEKYAVNEFKQALKGTEFIGFNTYGEQSNSIHMNHTLTGIALGE